MTRRRTTVLFATIVLASCAPPTGATTSSEARTSTLGAGAPHTDSTTAPSSSVASISIPRVPPKPEPLPTEPAERITEIQRRLRLLEPFEDGALPLGAATLFTHLKTASRDLVVAQFDELLAERANDLRSVSDADIERRIEEVAHLHGISVLGHTTQDAPSVGDWFVSITRSKRDPRFLVAGWQFMIPCGSDGGYLVYELTPGATRLALALQSPPFEAIDGAWWELAFALPPPGMREDFFFTAVRVTPWCTSALRQIEVVVARAGASPLEPTILLDEKFSYHLAGHHALDVRASEIRFRFTPHSPDQEVERRWSVSREGVKAEAK